MAFYYEVPTHPLDRWRSSVACSFCTPLLDTVLCIVLSNVQNSRHRFRSDSNLPCYTRPMNWNPGSNISDGIPPFQIDRVHVHTSDKFYMFYFSFFFVFLFDVFYFEKPYYIFIVRNNYIICSQNSSGLESIQHMNCRVTSNLLRLLLHLMNPLS